MLLLPPCCTRTCPSSPYPPRCRSQLPPSCLAVLDRLFRRIAADTPPPTAMLREVYSLGQGVAFRIESPELLAIRARIAAHFAGMLTAQAMGTQRLHITVQNKVEHGRAPCRERGGHYGWLSALAGE